MSVETTNEATMSKYFVEPATPRRRSWSKDLRYTLVVAFFPIIVLYLWLDAIIDWRWN